MLVVGYAVSVGNHDSRLFVLEDTWQEMLGAISEESLANEGFPDMAHFRRYWMRRSKRRFRPLDKVQVYRVRPMMKGDLDALGSALIYRLYQEHLT